MADITLDTVLSVLGKVSSFASTFHPLFGVVSSVIESVRKGLINEECKENKDLQEIKTKLVSISEKNRKILSDLKILEMNVNYSKLEENIKHQYDAFKDMVEDTKQDPENANVHIEIFKQVYTGDKGEQNLEDYYRGVMGTKKVFEDRTLLNVYLETCGGNREHMEACCSHIAHVFHIGLIAHMGYTVATNDSIDGMQRKWAKMVEEIQKKMEEALSECKD